MGRLNEGRDSPGVPANPAPTGSQSRTVRDGDHPAEPVKGPARRRRDGDHPAEPVKGPARRRRDGDHPAEPVKVGSALELGELAKRVNELEITLAAITRTLAGPPTESAIQVDLCIAVDYGKVVGQIGEALRTGENRAVDAPDLKSFMDGLLGSVQRAGVETVLLAANEILRDPSSVKILRELAERPPPPIEMADRVTEEITPLDGPGPSALGLLVLAGALLLAAGVVIPVFAPVIAESILTNEVAIAATAISVAALIKDS